MNLALIFSVLYEFSINLFCAYLSGYMYSQDVMRQPITPTSSLAYVAKIQNEQAGGPLSPRERREGFSKTSRRYWSKVKQECKLNFHGCNYDSYLNRPGNYR
jgi:hypothetical protein